MGGKQKCRRRNVKKWQKTSGLRGMFAAWAWLDFVDLKKETWGLCSQLSPPFCQLEGFRWVELEEGGGVDEAGELGITSSQMVLAADWLIRLI